MARREKSESLVTRSPTFTGDRPALMLSQWVRAMVDGLGR